MRIIDSVYSLLYQVHMKPHGYKIVFRISVCFEMIVSISYFMIYQTSFTDH